MFLSLTTTGAGAGDLSWLLRKHPDRHQRFPLGFGEAHVFWPAFDPEQATCALFVDVDPVQLVRGRVGSDKDGPLAAYVNDRPYAASSLLSVAISRVFRSAMGEAPEQVTDAPRLYRIHLPVLPCHGGEGFLRRLWEPLGYTVQAVRHPRDPEVPAWGPSALYDVTLTATLPLASVLKHLYVLVPVLDDDKHYWVGADEVDKLLRVGEGWLESHPDKDAIALRYLKHRRNLARKALEALIEDAPADEEAASDEPTAEPRGEAALEKPLSLNQVRLARVVALLDELGVSEVADVGCGEGKLLRELLKQPQLTRILGIDVSSSTLELAERRLRLDERPERYGARLTLWNGSATYRDRRLDGVQALVLIEVVEHLELDRLPLLETAIFQANRPAHVVITTPNAEYNALFPELPAGRMRHSDHRFEWDRATFEGWAGGIGEQHGYSVRFEAVGAVDPDLGGPTQLAVFTRVDR